MTARWFAEWLDRAFIDLCIRPTLVTVTEDSPLTRLKLAEDRTKGGLSDTDLFTTQLAPTYVTTSSRRLPRGTTVLTRRWPAATVPVEANWFPEATDAQFVESKWYLRDRPRPLVVLVSGWQPSAALTARSFWPMQRLDRAGFDVVVVTWVPESTGSRRAIHAGFPTRDPLRNIVGLAKFANSLRQIVQLAHELGHPSIGIWGVSLGAYLVALLATIHTTSHADLYVMEKPLAKMSDPLRLHGRGASELRAGVAERLARVYRAVSPLERPPRVASTRVLVIGAEFDRVTPIAGAQALATHFGTQLSKIHAWHLVHTNRSQNMLAAVSGRLVSTFGQTHLL
jgi:pimeloyl-ACP methyl ester carboxylesterase